MSQPANRPSRMSDIAEAAGVSLATVSRVLNTPNLVAETTRLRVLQAVERLGYVPDRLAGSLVSRRSYVVGVVIPTITNSLFAETIDGLSSTLESEGYQLMMGSSRYNPEREAELVRMMISRRVDAMVLTGTTHDATTRKILERAALPVFEMWNLTDTPIDTVVGFSNFEAARQMTLYLADKGYRQIGYLGGLTTLNDRTQEREAGYVAALGERAMGPARIVRSEFDFRSGAAALRELLRLYPDVDAIFAASDVLAAGAMFECQRQGWAVPGRFGLAGLDDSVIAAELNPPITTVRLPRYEMGARIGKELLARLRDPDVGERHIDLGFQIVERFST